MTILVTGATGAVGRHLVASLVERGAHVRALTRSPQSAGLPADVDVVEGDLADPTTLGPKVFDGVDSALVFPVNGADAFVGAATDAGVERFTVLSSLAAAKEFPRDIGSASQLHHSAVELAVTSRTDAWTILRPGTFANNLLSWAWPIQQGWPLRVPYMASSQAPIHEADIADAAAAALMSERWIGQAIPLTGPQSLTRVEQVAAIGTGIGHELQLVEVTPDEFRSDVAAYVPEAIVKMLLDYWHDTVDQPDRVREGVAGLTGKQGRTLEQWARDHRADIGVAADV